MFSRKKKSVASRFIKPGSVLNIKDGEAILLTYTSSADKIKVFSTFIREGIENGDRMLYVYPDEDEELIRPVLIEHGIDVDKSERNGTLYMNTQTKHLNVVAGQFDRDKAVCFALDFWGEAERKGYKHVRAIDDVGDFSFVNGEWQRYLEYWNDPRWEDPKWALPGALGLVYNPFLMEITAFNVEGVKETDIIEILKAFGRGTIAPTRLIDLLHDANLFSRLIGLDHQQLLGRKILLEFDPTSDYEGMIERLVKETAANIEPIIVFTVCKSPLHMRLRRQPIIKFFLMSMSTSYLEPASEKEMLLPVGNTSLILDSIEKALKIHANANLFLVFDGLSDLLMRMGLDKTCIFLRDALEMLSSKNVTTLFLLSSNAHDPQVVSRIRGMFNNQLACDKNGLRVVKIFPLID